MISAAFLVKDPPLDRLSMLVEYLRPVVTDFVFVVDDRTAAETSNTIAQWEGCTVIPFRWVDDFSAGRNAALPHCRGDWTLIVDPDELPSRAMLDFCAMVDASEWSDVAWQGARYPAPRGYLFFTKNYEDGVQGPEWEEHWHCRLFRTSEASWYRPAHELVSLGGMGESSIRGTALLPKAPRSAYLIHSKMSDDAAERGALYTRIAAGTA
jgi:hypothetical protein